MSIQLGAFVFPAESTWVKVKKSYSQRRERKEITIRTLLEGYSSLEALYNSLELLEADLHKFNQGEVELSLRSGRLPIHYRQQDSHCKKGGYSKPFCVHFFIPVFLAQSCQARAIFPSSECGNQRSAALRQWSPNVSPPPAADTTRSAAIAWWERKGRNYKTV